MNAIKSYVGVYSRLYKLIVLIVSPLAFIGLIMFALPGAYQPLYVYMWATMVMSYVELYGEFFSIGGIYKRRAPFGSLLMSSAAYRGFMRRFAITDVLRRLLYFIAVDLLPLLLLAVFYDGQGVSIGISPGLAFLVALLSFALSQLAVWAYRLLDHPMATVFILIVMSIAEVLTIIWLMFSAEAETILYPIGITTAIAASGLSIKTLIKKTEDDYADIKK